MCIVPRLSNKKQLRLRESLETAERRVGVSRETVTGQYGRENGSYGVEAVTRRQTSEDTSD
jgi:hypothetical protein